MFVNRSPMTMPPPWIQYTHGSGAPAVGGR